jgi:hypothetical protein
MRNVCEKSALTRNDGKSTTLLVTDGRWIIRKVSSTAVVVPDSGNCQRGSWDEPSESQHLQVECRVPFRKTQPTARHQCRTHATLLVPTLNAVVRKAGYAIKPLTALNPPYGLRALGNEGELFGVADRLYGEVHIKVRPIQVMRSRTLDIEQLSY